ncbi:MAG: diguanylate cyclase [Anaerolineae bacterium]|jgi:diguanylate cyclase (GGDEF)-like protein|nr:diguanylate cyclase [Anaerolineae bacterium]
MFNPYTLYLWLNILTIGILSFAMYYTFARLEARGAKPLFLFLFTMIGFTAMFFASQIARSPQGKENMIIPGYGFLFLMPITWTVLVYDITERDLADTWHFNLPFGILNLAGFSLFFFDIPSIGGLIDYHTCQLNGPLYSCAVDNSFLFSLVVGLILLEMFGGVIFLVYSYFVFKQDEIRTRYLFLVGAVLFGTIAMALAGTVLNEISVIFDPVPFVMLVWSVLMVLAIYNKRLLLLTFGQPNRQLVDDLLLVINADHYIQDVNMSTLNVFGVEVQEVISTQLEHAFRDYPNIIRLFTESSLAAEPILLTINDEEHTFEPKVSVVLDPETSLPAGQRLQLHDVTGKSTSDRDSGRVTIMRDPLTNQYTKDSFYQFGKKLMINTRLRKQPTCVVVIDVDDLNMINERFSHLVGDQGLIQLVEIINGMIRSTDLLSRFTGDELVLMLPNADEFEAFQVCSRIQKRVSENRFSFQGQEFQMSVSMGYTVSDVMDEHELIDVVHAAYLALEQSHSLGRGRLTFLPVDVPEI